MNDRDIQSLVRMASEIDRLEREALLGPDLSEPRLVGAGHSHRYDIRYWLSLGAVSVAAAGLALGAFIALQPTTPTVSPGPALAAGVSGDRRITLPVASDFEQPLNAAPAPVQDKPGQTVLVMSLFKDENERCACYQWQTHELDADEGVEDLGRAELVNMALREPCSTDAQRVIVIAVGDRHGTPGQSNAAAQNVAEIARRVAEIPMNKDAAGAYAAAMPHLFPDATVVTETVSMLKPRLQLTPPLLPAPN